MARPFVPGMTSHDAPRQSAGFVEPVVTAERRAAFPDIAEFLANSDELPPVEHFLDPLPDVEAFAPDAEGALSDAGAETEFPYSANATADQGWVEDTWQQYDWRAAAALGDGPETEASNEWATTDWDSGAPVARAQKGNAADAIASALDQIARRIRDGELAIPAPDSLADPATIAATLAALLGVRR